MPFPDYPWVPKTAAGVTNANAPVGVVVASGATGVTGVTFANVTDVTVSVKLYDKAVPATVGADVPIHTFNVGAFASESVRFGPIGLGFASGVCIAFTKLMDPADAQAVKAGSQWTVTRSHR